MPQGQQLSLDLLGWSESEVDVEREVLVRKQPPHRFRTDLLYRLVEPDGVPGALVHRSSLVVVHLLVGHHRPVGQAALQRHAHKELGVEPEPELLPHLRDEIRREPLLPGAPVIAQIP